MEKRLEEIYPIMDVEHDCILSKQGDITIAYKATLPEIFTLSNEEYEALHQALVKAVKVLPKNSILHKQDWFISEGYNGNFEKAGDSFLSKASEQFFDGRPYLHHECYLFLTKTPDDRRPSTSVVNSLTRPNLVPEQTLNKTARSNFEDSCGQFAHILSEAGIKMERLKEKDISSSRDKAGIIERYLFLSSPSKKDFIKDIQLKDELKIGENHVQLYTLADAQDLPSLCGSRINYDKYSTDRTKFSVGFAATLGLLLPVNHIYNQYIVIGDVQVTIKKLESKKLRLQSLAAYSRENAIARDAVNDFLNECIADQSLPVKGHFNLLCWTDNKEELKDIRNSVTTALAQIDAMARQETIGAAQIFWAGIPGNASDLPLNETFDTFAAQACCFFNLETNYRDSDSSFGIRLGDRLTGKPVQVDISDEPMKSGICTNRNKFVLGPSACRAILH